MNHESRIPESRIPNGTRIETGTRIMNSRCVYWSVVTCLALLAAGPAAAQTVVVQPGAGSVKRGVVVDVQGITGVLADVQTIVQDVQDGVLAVKIAGVKDAIEQNDAL